VTKPQILMTGPMMEFVTRQLDAVFEVHKLWQADDADLLLDRVADRVTGIATAGHAPVNLQMMQRLPKLGMISNFGVGYDSVNAVAAGARGIFVSNTPDVLTEEVADTAIGLLLMTARELSASERYLRNSQWPNANYQLSPLTLRNRTLGIIGLGRIGKAIAARALSFGLKIAYCGRSRQNDVDFPYFADPVQLAGAVDTLLVVVPGGEATANLVNGAVLSALGPQGILINIGRGSVVDQQALIEALQAATIAAAGLDVFADEPNVPAELIAMDNVVLLPHVGSASVHTRQAMGQLVVDNLVAYFDTGKPLTPVPETPVQETPVA
jgi:lactate dehydrogenase-like 2-hydroxyacid dehydrogenase